MTISIDFKRFLPSNMREERWGEFMEAFQDLSGDLLDEKIKLLVTQYIDEEMTDDDYKNLINLFGWELSSYEGWADDSEYFRRQALTAVSRIIYKTTRKCYKDEFYIWNLWGDVYPLVKNIDNTLEPFEYFWDSDENPNTVDILDPSADNALYFQNYTFDGLFKFDEGQTFDQKYTVYFKPIASDLLEAWLDSPEIVRTLDEQSQIDYLSRQLLLQYRFKLAEDTTQFLSANSMRAFNNDVKQLKRKTERVYYEPILEINYNGTSGSTYTTEYETFDRTDTTEQQTFFRASNFSQLSSIHLGNSFHTIIDDSISGVASLSEVIPVSNLEIEQESDIWYIRRILYDFQETYDFSEIALYDSISGCFLYSTFPYCRYLSGELYSNIQFTFEDQTS